MIRPFGEAALLVETGSAARAGALAADLRADPIGGVVEAVPGLDSVLVDLAADAAIPRVADELAARLAALHGEPKPGRLRTIRVRYGGTEGPDLGDVARECGLTPARVIELHAGHEPRVLFCGFAPGFAYLGDLPDDLRVRRLGTPRTRTPAGSVAIAGSMSGIYPADLPGGWRVIGRTSSILFDPRRDPPAYLVPGDRVRFEPVDASAPERSAGPPADW